MKKHMKSLVSLLLAFGMLFGIGAVPAAAYEAGGGENGLYVYIGDSMTFDFVGSHNQFLDSAKIYAWQAAEAMGYATDDYGKFPGGRATDVYAALSDSYPGDAYSSSELGSYVSGEKAARFQEAVRSAKAVSVQVGYSELTTFLLANLINYLDEGELAFSCDLSQIFSQEELAKVMPFVSRVSALIEAIIPEDTRTAFAQYLAGLSDKEQEALVSVIGQEAFDTLSGVAETADALKDLFVYTMASAIVHFDAMVGEIYALNEDVDLYVLGLLNPVTQIRLGFALGEKEYSIPFGELSGAFYEIMNAYYRVFSPYSDRYYFVEVPNHVETYGERMTGDEDLTRRILYALYNGTKEGYETKANAAAYEKAEAQAPGVMQAIQNTTMIDIGKVIAELAAGGSLDTSEASFAKLAQYDESGKTTASYLEQLGAHVAAFQILKGIYVHPTQAGHNAEAPLLIAAMQNPKVDPCAIAYHKLAAPMEETIEALDNSDTVGDLIEWTKDVREIWERGEQPPEEEPTPSEIIGTVLLNLIQTLLATVRMLLRQLAVRP